MKGRSFTMRPSMAPYNCCKGSFSFFFLSLFSTSSAFFLFYVYYSTTKLHILHIKPPTLTDHHNPSIELLRIDPPLYHQEHSIPSPIIPIRSSNTSFSFASKDDDDTNDDGKDRRPPWQLPEEEEEGGGSKGVQDNNEVFHDRALFLQDYKLMNKTFKIYVYPHTQHHPFAKVLLPSNPDPGGNYASEACFKNSLFKSHFLTDDPSQAHLFYLPFSIASLRHDRRVGVGGIPGFVKTYIANISSEYPFWNQTKGADHFYVACHSVGRSAMVKAVEVKMNAIQAVCSSSHFLSGYIAHKDVSIPQIWPRKGRPPVQPPSQRKTLAFYAGAMNSREREFLVRTWGNDSDISVHRSRLKTPYSKALLGSKFCIHAKGFEVNTARIGDALYYGCVPVIIADHYDLPYAEILNWNTFSIVVPAADIPNLKKILVGVGQDGYLKMYRNVMKVQRHFLWNNGPVDLDAFHMVMYELWLRRNHVKMHR